MRPRILRSVPVVPPRKREGMSRQHINDVKALPCIACGRIGGSDPHHLCRGLPVGERGMGRRAADAWAVPTCRTHHEALHNAGNDDEWLAARGIDGRAIARSLWERRGDVKAMMRVVVRSLNVRGIFVDV